MGSSLCRLLCRPTGAAEGGGLPQRQGTQDWVVLPRLPALHHTQLDLCEHCPAAHNVAVRRPGLLWNPPPVAMLMAPCSMAAPHWVGSSGAAAAPAAATAAVGKCRTGLCWAPRRSEASWRNRSLCGLFNCRHLCWHLRTRAACFAQRLPHLQRLPFGAASPLPAPPAASSSPRACLAFELAGLGHGDVRHKGPLGFMQQPMLREMGASGGGQLQEAGVAAVLSQAQKQDLH